MGFKHRKLIMVAIFIATFMTSVETTIVTTAMPTIVSDLDGLSLQSWIFTAYLLATAITTPIYGKLADKIGRKPVFITGLVLFTFGSFMSGLSPNMITLIIARLIQGMGAGSVLPITNTIIADLFSFEQRATALAFNNTAWGISALLGPILGGAIVSTLGWHWVFFVNVPLGIFVLLIISIFYIEKIDNSKGVFSFDYLGTISLSVVILSLLFLFQELQKNSVNWVFSGVLLVVFLLTTIFFIHREKRVEDPLISLKVFRDRTFTAQILTAFLLSGAQFGFQVYFPMWLQSIYHSSAAIAGLVVSPSPIMWLVASFFVGMLIKRFAPKYINMSFIVLMTLSYIPIVLTNSRTPMAVFYIVSGISGIALGTVITTNTVIAQQVIGRGQVGMASSMLTLGRTMGQTVMTGMYGLVFNYTINRKLETTQGISRGLINKFINNGTHASGDVLQKLNNVMLDAQHNVFYLVIVILVLAFVVNYFDSQNKAVQG